MSNNRTGADGRTYRPTAAGQWVEVTPEQQAAEETSRAQAFIAQGGRNLDRLKQFLALSGQLSPESMRSQPVEAREAAEEIMRQGSLRERLFDPLDEAKPGASLGGQLVLDPLNVPLGGAGRAAGGAASTVKDRTLAALAAATPEGKVTPIRATGMVFDALKKPFNEIAERSGRSMGRAVNENFKRGSVGAGQVDEVARMTDLERGLFEMLAPERLTPDQQTLLDSGIAERLGIRLIPGQDRGINVIKAGAESDPILGKFVSEIAGENQEVMENLLMDALRAPGQRFGTDALATARRTGGELYNQVREAIPAQALPAEIADQVALIFPKKSQKLLGWEPGTELAGSDLLNMYRSIRNVGTRQATSGKEEVFKQNAIKVSENFREWIRGQMGDAVQQFDEANEIWMLETLLEKPGVIRNGRFSHKVFNNVLTRELPDEYRRQLTGPRPGRSEAFTKLLDGNRFLSAFETNINDSGTATRLGFQQMLSNPFSVVQRITARDFLLGLVDEIDPAVVQ